MKDVSKSRNVVVETRRELLETPDIGERIEAVMMRPDNGEGVPIDLRIKSEIDAWLADRQAVGYPASFGFI